MPSSDDCLRITVALPPNTPATLAEKAPPMDLTDFFNGVSFDEEGIDEEATGGAGGADLCMTTGAGAASGGRLPNIAGGGGGAFLCKFTAITGGAGDVATTASVPDHSDAPNKSEGSTPSLTIACSMAP